MEKHRFGKDWFVFLLPDALTARMEKEGKNLETARYS